MKKGFNQLGQSLGLERAMQQHPLFCYANYFTIFLFIALFGNPSVLKAQCSMTNTVNVSGCFDSNGNAAGGSAVATVQVIVDWTNNPSGETINVSCTGATAQTIDPATSAKPAILSFQVPANGAALTITATFSTASTCTVTKMATAPPACPLFTPCETGNTGGTVWRDYNNNGVKDAITETQGGEGVTVKAYNCNDMLVGTTTTDAKGQYTFGTLAPAPSATNKLRIEFSNIPPQYQPTFSGANGKTDVQFISGAACNVNLGINNSADYCQANPFLATPCYINGRPSTGDYDVLVSINDSLRNKLGTVNHLAKAYEIGSTWGIAYSRQTKRLYSAAFLKRHVALMDNDNDGKEDLGAIYFVDAPFAGVGALWLDVTALGVNVGQSLLPTVAARNFSTNAALPNNDAPGIFGLVGKIGIGDMDISDDGQTLYFVNLYDKSLYAIDINSKTIKAGFPVAVPNNCSGGSIRPFGLGIDNGSVYVGAVCDASSSKNASDMQATVFRLNGGSFQTALQFPLNYTKGAAFTLGTCTSKRGWYAWEDSIVTPAVGCYNLSSGAKSYVYPTPILSDIEFDGDGHMVLGFLDRTGHQMGWFNWGPVGTDAYITVIGGDLLRAAPLSPDGQTFVLENNGVIGSKTSLGVNNGQGLGGGEFYYQDNHKSDGHQEISNGGVAVIKSNNSVAYTAMDPVNIWTGGVKWASNTNGDNLGGFDLFGSSNYANSNVEPTTFGKSNGLGDLTPLCNEQPIQVGNYVWIDTDKDGVQDPCEPPFSMVTVSLWKNGVQIATTTTDANGNYNFSSKSNLGTPTNWTGTGADTTLLPNTAYELRIGTTQTAIAGTNLSLSPANVTANLGNDQNDSDAALVGTDAVITFTTGAAGATNQTLDFGFKPCPSLISATPTTQTLCVGKTGTNITVSTDYNATDGTKFVRFTTDQMSGTTPTATEAAAIYAGTSITTVTASGSVAPYSAIYTWNNADFPNTTNVVIKYYVYAIANPDAGANCRPLLEVTITVNPVPTGGVTTVTKATCTNGVTNTNGKIEITGITNGAKYSYGISGTTGLFALNGATLSAGAITVSNLGSPVASTTYTFRIYGADTTCYQDITAVLDPSVCPPCSITATFTQNACNSNNTSAITTDDYFTVTVSGVTATNGGTSGKYEVMLNGTTLNTGGTAFGTSVTVGGILYFKSDNITTYTLTVKDSDIPTCTAIFTTAPSAPCSVVGCKPVICLPVTITKR